MHSTRGYRTVQGFVLFITILLISAKAMAVGYHVDKGKIYDASGQHIQIRGISHFGFNAKILRPMYLWQMDWVDQIVQIQGLGFNSIRVPFVPETLYDQRLLGSWSYMGGGSNNAVFKDKTSLQALDIWLQELEDRGIYYMLDFHSPFDDHLHGTWVVDQPGDLTKTYNGQPYPQESWIRDLVFVAKRYANHKYFLGVELFNEPHGRVRWEKGDDINYDRGDNPKYYYKQAIEQASNAVIAANPDILVFIQGTMGNWDGQEDSSLPMNWGENLQPLAYKPLKIPNNKLVLTPHTYGPDVHVKSSFSAANYPNNLAADWETLFGQFYPTYAMVPSEWGGRYGNGPGGKNDVLWQDAFVDYMLSKGMTDSFYWCYTPNSGDTGGILDDKLNVREDKMALLRRLWGTAAPEPPIQEQSTQEPPTQEQPIQDTPLLAPYWDDEEDEE